MPREGVPYPERMLCSLKCELKNIWNALNGKLHSVNGVEGDGQGNVTIVSENTALEIHDYPLQNQIGISLDTSQLPAANVDSVNGQTGVVALNADDIPSDGGSDVQADIDALKLADTTLQGNITAEATARGNADSALQTNINTVTASLPGAAAAAVAADPTIAQLVTDMNDKVDVTDVSTVETPNTIAKRNGSGRLVAADPASGATDKTLVTANWISQTGNSAPNNVMHRNGNESYTGTKTTDALQVENSRPYLYQRVNSSSQWYKVFSITNTPQARRVFTVDVIWSHQSYSGYGAGRIILASVGAAAFAKWVYRVGNASAFTADTIFIGTNSTTTDIWVKAGYFAYVEIERAIKGNVEQVISEINNVYDGQGVASIDTTVYDIYAYGSD